MSGPGRRTTLTSMRRRRILLLCVAGLLSASALLAIAVLLVGRFGGTEGRILATTALLGGYGLVALPATVLLDQQRHRRLATAAASVTSAAAGLALLAVWAFSGSDALGKAVGALTAFALAGAQICALAARRRPRDPPVVARLFAVSCGTVLAAATTFAALIWTQPGGLAPRLVGALVVLDLLLGSLQPILARARTAPVAYRFTVVLASGETIHLSVEGGDVASAAAKAIRAAERVGDPVARVEVSGEARTGT